MRAGQLAAGDDEIARAGDALFGIPAIAGQELIEHQRLERGSGRGDRAGSLVEVVRGENAVRGDIENKDARVGGCARRALDGRWPSLGTERLRAESDGERRRREA